MSCFRESVCLSERPAAGRRVRAQWTCQYCVNVIKWIQITPEGHTYIFLCVRKMNKTGYKLVITSMSSSNKSCLKSPLEPPSVIPFKSPSKSPSMILFKSPHPDLDLTWTWTWQKFDIPSIFIFYCFVMSVLWLLYSSWTMIKIDLKSDSCSDFLLQSTSPILEYSWKS